MDRDSGYRWRMKWRVIPSQRVDCEEESTSIGWDIKITPDGEPVIIELHPNGHFCVEGFKRAFQHGDISPLIQTNPFHTRDSFTRFIRDYTNRKDISHMMIGQYMADLFDENSDYDGLVVTKPVDGACGMMVHVLDRKSLKKWPEYILVELFVPSKDIYYQGEAYDGCMRYVTNLYIKRGEMVVESLGGYWRIARAPKHSHAPYDERYVSNLALGGRAVPASPEDMLTASRIAVQAASELYKEWLLHKEWLYYKELLHKDRDQYERLWESKRPKIVRMLGKIPPVVEYVAGLSSTCGLLSYGLLSHFTGSLALGYPLNILYLGGILSSIFFGLDGVLREGGTSATTRLGELLTKLFQKRLEVRIEEVNE
jgi:hypothetical protein